MSDGSPEFKPTPEESKETSRLLEAKKAGVIALEIEYSQAQAIKERIQETLNVGADEQAPIVLRDRGEAHLSILQFKRNGHPVTAELTDADLKILESVKGKPVHVIGVGTIPQGSPSEIRQGLAENPNTSLTTFLVVDLPQEILEWMADYANRYNNYEPDPNNHLRTETPHITIGFTERDRFDQAKQINPNFNNVVGKYFAENPLTFGNLIGQFSHQDENGRWVSQYQPI